MKETASSETIKFSPYEIVVPAIDPYVHLVYILLILALIKFTFGTQIRLLCSKMLTIIKEIKSTYKISTWIASCKERKNWPNKQDSKSLDLRGMYIKSLYFTVTVTGNPKHWRAGFVVGNEKFKANDIVNTENGITIHTGSQYEKQEKLLPVWKYYEGFELSNPDYSVVKFDNMAERDFSVEFNTNNFMKVKVQNEVVFAQRVDPAFRRRVFLKAWADESADCKIKFKKIKYSLWSE